MAARFDVNTQTSIHSINAHTHTHTQPGALPIKKLKTVWGKHTHAVKTPHASADSITQIFRSASPRFSQRHHPPRPCMQHSHVHLRPFLPRPDLQNPPTSPPQSPVYRRRLTGAARWLVAAASGCWCPHPRWLCRHRARRDALCRRAGWREAEREEGMGTRGSQTEAEAADKRDSDTKGALGVGDERGKKKRRAGG